MLCRSTSFDSEHREFPLSRCAPPPGGTVLPLYEPQIRSIAGIPTLALRTPTRRNAPAALRASIRSIAEFPLSRCAPPPGGTLLPLYELRFGASRNSHSRVAPPPGGTLLPLYELRFGASREFPLSRCAPPPGGRSCRSTSFDSEHREFPLSRCAPPPGGTLLPLWLQHEAVAKPVGEVRHGRHQPTPFQPGRAAENSPWREPWDHRQVDRAPARGERSRRRRLPPPAGAFHARHSPMADAMGYALPLYELRFGASRNSHSRVAHPHQAERSCRSTSFDSGHRGNPTLALRTPTRRNAPAALRASIRSIAEIPLSRCAPPPGGTLLPLYELRFGASRNSHSRVAHPVDAGCGTQKWGDCGIGRKSSRFTRSEYLQTPFQPGRATENSPWREPWEHRQVDRAPARGDRSRRRRLPPPAGAFRARHSPMADAMGYALPLYELRFGASRNSHSRVAHPHLAERSCRSRSFDSEHRGNSHSRVAHPHQAERSCRSTSFDSEHRGIPTLALRTPTWRNAPAALRASIRSIAEFPLSRCAPPPGGTLLPLYELRFGASRKSHSRVAHPEQCGTLQGRAANVGERSRRDGVAVFSRLIR